MRSSGAGPMLPDLTATAKHAGNDKRSATAPGGGAGAPVTPFASQVKEDIPLIAQRIRVRRAFLAAARQQGGTAEVQEEIQRHEAVLEVLLAEEKAAIPPESRLRSLLDRVRHKESILASEDAKVKELSEQLQTARSAAEETRSSLATDKAELAALQAKMSAANASAQARPSTAAGTAQALEALLAATKALANPTDLEQARGQLQQAALRAEAVLQ